MSYYDQILRGRPERCPVCDEFNLIYGFGWVDEPRDFKPDEDCATGDEKARWSEDCARVESGATAQNLPRGCRRSSYGLGTYWSPSCDHQEVAG